MAMLTVTILGCGSSGGVPRLSGSRGGEWGSCDPDNPRNARRRCSILLTLTGNGGATRVLIDTSPDMRAQLLDAGIGQLDAVAYTHSHADHVHGIDDLRQIVQNTGRRLPVWADPETAELLLARFAYIFIQPRGSDYPSICELNTIAGPFTVSGAGGPLTLTPFAVRHGTMDALGFRVGNVAYIPDVSDVPDAAWPHLSGLECWIIDALRYAPHPSHAHLARSLDWISRARPAQAVLTNMHYDLDYATVAAETPDHVVPAYDGMTLTFPV